jgi:hypothetical protein
MNWDKFIFSFSFLFIFPNWAQHTAGPTLFLLTLLFNVGRWICFEINPLNDERPRCVCYFLLNCNFLQTSNFLRDSSMHVNTRVCASRIVLLRFIVSPVNSFTEICAGGVVGD